MSFKVYSINVSLSVGHIIGQRYVTYQRKPISKSHAVDVFDVINLVFVGTAVRGQEHG